MNAAKSLDAPIYRHMVQSQGQDLNRASLSDRRNTLRGPAQTKAKLIVIDGAKAGTTHEIMTRDASLSGISFLLRESLAVGQQCQIEFDTSTGGATKQAKRYLAEVVRSRAISAGRFEMAVQFRKQV